MSVVTDARPRTIKTAVTMLSVVVIYGFVASVVLVATGHVAKAVPPGVANPNIVVFTVLIGALLGFAVRAFLIYKVFERRNWARITYLVFFVFGVLFATRDYKRLFFHPATLNYPVAMGYLGIVCALIELVALVLLFSGAGGLWFNRSPA